MSQAEKRARRRRRKKWVALMARIDRSMIETVEKQDARFMRRAKLKLSEVIR